MKTSHNFLLSILILFSFSTCQEKNDLLKKSLLLAGNNRPELEKALQHYRDQKDSLKYLSAYFLIENMHGHYSFDTTDLHLYRPFLKVLNSIGSESFRKEKLDEKWFNTKQQYPIEKHLHLRLQIDNKYITSDYLIRNINLAIKAWKENPYGDSISFQQFCEYVLPYRKQERLALEDWRSFFYNKHARLLSTQYPKPITEVIDSLLFQYKDYVHSYSTPSDFPFLKYEDLLSSQHSLCAERCWFNIMLLSSLGFPTTMDYVPAWGNRNYSHVWNTLQFGNTFYAFESFWDIDRWKYRRIYDNVTDDIWWGPLRLPKVFRYTYKFIPQGQSFDNRVKKEDVPPLFQNSHQMDVSSEYFSAKNVLIDIPQSINAAYGYLCVYNNNAWTPVQWGKIVKNQILFKDMGCDIIYLLAIYKNNETIPIGNPFQLKYDGTIEYMQPQKESETVKLIQTSPLCPEYAATAKSLIGGKLQLASNYDFSDAYDIAVIPNDIIYSKNFQMPTPKPFRYMRFVFPNQEHISIRGIKNKIKIYGNIGEIRCLDADSSIIVQEKIIHSAKMDYTNVSRAFDGEPYTSMSPIDVDSIPKEEAWIGIDFGKKKQVKSIEFIAKNDDIYLYEEWRYELLYWNDGRWNSVGNKQVKSNNLIFDNVPKGALLILKCYSKNLKERIFTYENCKQVWW